MQGLLLAVGVLLIACDSKNDPAEASAPGSGTAMEHEAMAHEAAAAQDTDNEKRRDDDAMPGDETPRAVAEADEDSSAQDGGADPVSGPDSLLASQALQLLGRLPEPPKAETALVQLGQRLFFETAVSADGKVGCVTCHNAEHYGADGLTLARGVFDRENPRNSPTVFNAAPQYAQHWRADRESVEDQAQRALLGMASFGLTDNAEAVMRIRAIPGMEAAFAAAFPDADEPVTVEHWGTAIGAFERQLLTPSPFDAFLEGDTSALSADAQKGLSLFLELGCVGCHSGPLLGGAGARKFGIAVDYWTLTGSEPPDPGRFAVTDAEEDRYVFKVPPLRNVAKTAPYFHDGSVNTLQEAVGIMAKTQLDVTLDDTQLTSLVAFLESLTGEIPALFQP